MSGGNRCLYALVFALWFGTSWNCWADETSTGKVQPKVNQTLELEILKRPPAPKQGENISPEDAIRRALETRVRAKIDEAPLQDVCTAIGKQLRIPIILDRKSLYDEGLDGKIPVSCSINNDRLLIFLERMLHELDLTWVIDREVLLVITKSYANEMLATRIYDVSDLIAVPEFCGSDIRAVAELLTTLVAPECWITEGGVGYITIVEGHDVGSLIISQTLNVHDDIEKQLATLRKYLPKKRNATGKCSDKNKQKGSGTHDALEPKKKKILSKKETIRCILRNKIDLNFENTPLTKVAEHLGRLLKTKVILHKISLENEGLDIETPVNFQVYGLSAASALKFMLSDFDLTYVIKDDFLLILASCTEQHEFLEIEHYDITDLTGGDFISDDFVDSIIRNVYPSAWSTVGGEGTIIPFENCGARLLVVKQTQGIHLELQNFLEDLRKIQNGGATQRHVPEHGEEASNTKADSSQKKSSSKQNTGDKGLHVRVLVRNNSAKPQLDWLDSSILFEWPGPLAMYCQMKTWNTHQDALIKSNNRFAFKLYDRLNEGNQDENIFFSPISISIAMAIAHAGARGKTADEVAKVMHFDLPLTRLHPTHQSLLAIMESQPNDKYELKVSNCIWAQSGQVFCDDFQGIIRHYYGVECGLVNFFGNRDATVETMNTWIKRKTKSWMCNTFRTDSFDNNTRLVLTNP